MRRVILAICATAAALVLLLSFKSHTQSAVAGGSPAAALGVPGPGEPSAGKPGTGKPGPASSRRASSGKTRGTGASGTARTVTGDAFDTVYGPVQVRITVTAGEITGVTAVQYPQGTPRDYQINAFAIPQLDAETLAASSADIDTVSGATYTSQGYIGSLQSAIDQAAR
jgi:uncharacterized protein with FMN-binding domain